MLMVWPFHSLLNLHRLHRCGANTIVFVLLATCCVSRGVLHSSQVLLARIWQSAPRARPPSVLPFIALWEVWRSCRNPPTPAQARMLRRYQQAYALALGP